MLEAYPIVGTTASARLIIVTMMRVMLIAFFTFNGHSQELTIDTEYGCLVNHMTSS